MLPLKQLARVAYRQQEVLRHRASACVLQARAQSAARRSSAESFLSGTSSNYLEDLYDRWLEDPKSVDASFDVYFRKVTEGVKEAYLARPAHELALTPRSKPLISMGTQPQPTSSASQREIDQRIDEHLCVYAVIRAHQTRGNFLANLDPLGIQQQQKHKLPGMTIEEFGMGAADLEKTFILPRSAFIGGEQRSLSLRDIMSQLRKVYAGSIGVQYTYINNYDQLMWLRRRIEWPDVNRLTVDEKKLLLGRLIRSTRFEEYLGRKWNSEKRFGLDGCEVLIPCMKTVLDVSSALGTESFIIGMPHRGRLNVLANVCRKPLEKIFCQFDSKLSASDEGSGDVKYHLGMCHERINRATNKKIRLAVVANPSHLEAVDPVVQGRTYAEQFYRGDTTGKKVMSIMLHGDAAFAGQGVVFETFHLSELPAYSTKGTIHIVVNNQVGFTTDPRVARSSPFCTDVAKVCNAPIFHVNADDAEAVTEVAKMAAEWRHVWGKDVVIDLVCYRRFGHNETDEPSFTQPLMYQIIRQKPKSLELYAKKLMAEGVVTKDWYDNELSIYDKVCEDAYGRAKKETAIRNRDWLDSPWENFFDGREELAVPVTGVAEEHLLHIAQRFSEEPADLNLHAGLKRTLAARRELLKARVADWAMGEAFAFGSLLREGVHVRLSGQDVERGTFSHRHHMLHDQLVDRKMYCPLKNLWPSQAQYTVSNSSLSEYGVLGFELGYSLTNPNALVCWEAQFGDFANTAQCIIDQFIASGQAKWVRQSAITLLLPHGMEGMGPEHSSARLERFLQLANDDPDVLPPEVELKNTFDAQQLREANWFVCNCTTPANLFHVLRRQIALPYRKPLVLMTPKSLLRLPEARSSFEQFLGDTKFQTVIMDTGPAAQHADAVQKVLFCSGRVYYDLAKERERLGLNEEVAIVRVEQLFPFPYRKVAQVLKQFPTARLCWVQEEHKNAGGWSFVQPRFATLIEHLDPKKRQIKYCGRAPSAATATGNKHMHLIETSKLLNDALGDVNNVIF